MRIRIRAVPISFRSRFYSRRLCRARRRRWSSRAFCCSRDTCSTFCAIRGPSRAPVRRRTRRRRNVDNLCRAGLWLWRCRSRLYEELPRCDSEKFTIPLIRNLLNRHHRVARNERINLKLFNELLFFFFSSREIWIRWNSNLFPFERLVVRSFSGITIRKTTPCKVEPVDIDRRLKFRVADVKRPSRIEFDQYRRATRFTRRKFYIYIFFFFCKINYCIKGACFLVHDTKLEVGERSCYYGCLRISVSYNRFNQIQKIR